MQAFHLVASLLTAEELALASRVCQSWRAAITGDNKLYRRLHVDLSNSAAVRKAVWWCQRSSRMLHKLEIYFTDVIDVAEHENGIENTTSRIHGVFTAIQNFDGGQNIDSVSLYVVMKERFDSYFAIVATLESLALMPAVHDFDLTIYCQFYFPLEVDRRFFGFLCRVRQFQFHVQPFGDDFYGNDLIPAKEHPDWYDDLPMLGKQDVLYGGPRSLPAMSYLFRLDFYGLIFHTKIDIPDMPRLRLLSIEYCRLGQAFYRLLGAVPQLERLSVRNLVQDSQSQLFEPEADPVVPEPEPIELAHVRVLDVAGEISPAFWAPETDEQAAEMVPRPEILMPDLRVARLIDMGTLDQEEDDVFKYQYETARHKEAAGMRKWRRKMLCSRMGEHEPEEAEELMLEMEDDGDWIEPGMDALYRLLTLSGENITQLVLDGSVIDDTSLLDSLRDIPSIEQLKLRGTRISGDHLPHICCELTNLHLLDVRECPRVYTHHVASASGAAVTRGPGPRLSQILITDPGPYAWGMDPLESEFHLYERLAWQWLSWRGVLVDWEADLRGARRRGKQPWTRPLRLHGWNSTPAYHAHVQSLRAAMGRRK